MKTYTELKNKKIQIEEQINEKNKERKTIENTLVKVSSLFPEGVNLVLNEQTDIEKELERVKQEIILSDELKSTKETIITILVQIEEQLKENTEKITELKKELSEIEKLIKERTKYVEQTLATIEQNKKEIENFNNQQAKYQQMLDDEEITPLLKETIKKAMEQNAKKQKLCFYTDAEIIELRKEKELIDQDNNITSENTKKEKSAPSNNSSSSETTKEEVSVNPEVAAMVSKVFDGQENTNNNTENNPDTEEVVDTHEASPELIEKIKKAGKITVGIATIACTIAAISTTPYAWGAVFGGAVIYNVGKKVYHKGKDKIKRLLKEEK